MGNCLPLSLNYCPRDSLKIVLNAFSSKWFPQNVLLYRVIVSKLLKFLIASGKLKIGRFTLSQSKEFRSHFLLGTTP